MSIRSDRLWAYQKVRNRYGRAPDIDIDREVFEPGSGNKMTSWDFREA